ncbi:MAG: hypothetical protein ACFFG0_14205 [Candidatus Thorarchaeota archaeon]
MLKKILFKILVWQKPLLKNLLQNELTKILQEKINTGAIDKTTDKAIKDIINDFCKKYL